MNDILYDRIPSLDLEDFTSQDPQRKAKFVRQLGEAYQNIGFVAFKNHGLSETLTASLYRAVKEFFALPEAIKLNYEIPDLGGQRGYTAKGKEHAKGRTIGDLKEFFHIGQEITPDERSHLSYPANIFPQEVPQFAPATIEAFQVLEATGIQILRAIALYLELDEFYFDDKVKQGNSILRTIHYFPLDNTSNLTQGAVRAAAHGDINLITLLMGASAAGLEILRRDGAWIPVTALPDAIVVNVGDMLERLTNNKLKSTVHRVINPPEASLATPRYSIPFFMHPISAMDLSCLASCIDEDNPKQFPDITAGEFLNLRLREIGLIN